MDKQNKNNIDIYDFNIFDEFCATNFYDIRDVSEVYGDNIEIESSMDCNDVSGFEISG